jgi:hypothetical protein
MNKKIVAVVASAGLALACAAPAYAGPREDNLFVKLVRTEARELKSVPKKQLISLAKETCKFLREGFDVLDAVEIAEDEGIRTGTAIALVAGAVVFYCPEQERYI